MGLFLMDKIELDCSYNVGLKMAIKAETCSL